MFERFGVGHPQRKLLLILCWPIVSSILVCAQTREQMDKYEESYFPGILFRDPEAVATSEFTGKCPSLNRERATTTRRCPRSVKLLVCRL